MKTRTLTLRNTNANSLRLKNINNPCQNLAVEIFSVTTNEQILSSTHQDDLRLPYTLAPEEEIEFRFKLSANDIEEYTGFLTIETEAVLHFPLDFSHHFFIIKGINDFPGKVSDF